MVGIPRLISDKSSIYYMSFTDSKHIAIAESFDFVCFFSLICYRVSNILADIFCDYCIFAEFFSGVQSVFMYFRRSYID